MLHKKSLFYHSPSSYYCVYSLFSLILERCKENVIFNLFSNTIKACLVLDDCKDFNVDFAYEIFIYQPLIFCLYATATS